MSFASFNLPIALSNTLTKQNIKRPFPIQQAVIPPALEGKDVLGIAQTGSGKTLAYVLPILTKLNFFPEGRNRSPQVLVMVPTRELAQQVLEVIKLFVDINRNHSKTVAVFGGTSKNPQMQAMTTVKIVIATPGRLLDLIKVNSLKLSDLRLLVIDEADKLLNIDFKKDLDDILKLIPSAAQKLLFSATLSPDVQKLKKLYLNNPAIIELEQHEEKVELIKQSAYAVEEGQKGPFLRYLIKSRDLKQVMVFTSSIATADKVADKLRKNGVDALAVHSKKSQHARNESLRDFKEGKIKVLVTTDLLSRGIDIEYLPFVINYELPRSPKDFVHRVGRTGRAEHAGEAISLISANEEHHFKVIQKKVGLDVDLEVISDVNLHGF
ncbi:ATP-dependent RNA helicase RhlE [Marivirga sericea]|uniref:ATP-dependent RNA helicase RhlE n=1 Tax=Marivirga sericea TaxID=1028 RepID=A0A1X7JJK9_9BACT|nr:DEAD/DEAH box helicase [Marivirga sericea]SMG28320.1 ATP-dependent RNA helicase RhlE [Marivirga sericea]